MRWWQRWVGILLVAAVGAGIWGLRARESWSVPQESPEVLKTLEGILETQQQILERLNDLEMNVRKILVRVS